MATSNTQFAIGRLEKAARYDIREQSHTKRSDDRYFLATMDSGYRLFVKLSASTVERAGCALDLPHTPVSDELDAALKANDWQEEANFKLLVQIAKHVASGHYNNEIVEALRKVCEIEKLYKAEAILASAPNRTACGPIESWCLSAIHAFQMAEFSRHQDRRSIIDRFGK